MGKAWFDASAEARAAFEAADSILTDLPAPLTTLCFEGPAETLNRTDVSQPAIYCASVACWRAMLAEMGAGSAGEANVVGSAGLSLGEYTALHLAGAFSFEDGLRLVALRGRAMQEAAEAGPSSMTALIGADEAQATEVCDEARGDGVLVCANFNAPGQVVLSGSTDACERAESIAEGKGLRSARLPVAGAFHSPFMAPAADRLREALASTDIRSPAFGVYSNVTAGLHESDPDSIRGRLVEQLTSPVRWADCVLAMISNLPGAEPNELAPGKTLAGLARRTDRSWKVKTHDTPS